MTDILKSKQEVNCLPCKNGYKTWCVSMPLSYMTKLSYRPMAGKTKETACIHAISHTEWKSHLSLPEAISHKSFQSHRHFKPFMFFGRNTITLNNLCLKYAPWTLAWYYRFLSTAYSMYGHLIHFFVYSKKAREQESSLPQGNLWLHITHTAFGFHHTWPNYSIFYKQNSMRADLPCKCIHWAAI